MVSDRALKALRQDSVSSDTGHDVRRTAMDTLKGHLVPSDLKNMPDFLDQVSESTEAETSQPYAISLYGELAKVHKHELIPFIPRIMASIVRSLPSSGGSQQLQQECAKVLASVARYTIDPARAPSSNEEVIRSLCSPLLPALSSRIEPLAVGAAVCLQALVESEKWKCAPLDLQELLCAKGTAALAEKATQTVAHIHLMRSLAKLNSYVVQQHGGKLVVAGIGMLQAAPDMSGSWRQRMAAVQLVGAVLKIADIETLHLDLSPIVGILEGYCLDKVPGIRTVAADALQTAKVIGAEVAVRHDTNSEDADPERIRVLLSKNQVKRRGSKMEEPTSREIVVPSDTLFPNSETPLDGTLLYTTPSIESLDKCPKRSPLFPVKQSCGKPTGASLSNRGSFKSSKLKENTPAGKPIEGFSSLPASFRVRSERDLLDVRSSNDLAATHQDGYSLQSLVEDSSVFDGSKSLRASISDLESGSEDTWAPRLHEKVAGNENNGANDQFCKGTMRKRTAERKFGIFRETSFNNADQMSSPDFTKRSTENVANGSWNMIASTKGSGDAEGVCKDGNACGEMENYKYGSRDTNRSVGFVENALCNGFADFPSTPDSKQSVTSGLTDSSENGDKIQSRMNAEDGQMCPAPRSLLYPSSSDGSLWKFKKTTGVNQKDGLNFHVETLSETSWNSTVDNLISGESEDDRVYKNQKVHSGSGNDTGSTATSSCCSMEELDLHRGRHVIEMVQNKDQSLHRNDKDCKCSSMRLNRLSMETAHLRQLSRKDGSTNLLYNDRHEESGAMEGIHDDSPVGDEGSSLLTFHKAGAKKIIYSEGTAWSVSLKGLKMALSFISRPSGLIVQALLILVIASLVVRHLSSIRDSHVLVPT